MKLADVDKFATSLPGVTVTTKWRNKTYAVGDKGFAWERPLNKADIKRFGDETPPAGDIIAVRVESLDAKDALLAMDLKGFFTIEHFNNYAAVLIALKQARVSDVKAAIRDAHRVMSTDGLVAKPSRRSPSPRRRPARRASARRGTA
jgi:hypothetical protein